MAFGEIGLLPREFYEMSWREFFLMYRGRRKRDENEYIRDATLTREVAYQIYCAMPLAKGKRHIGKKKYWQLPIDKESIDKETQVMMEGMKKLRENGSRN